MLFTSWLLFFIFALAPFRLTRVIVSMIKLLAFLRRPFIEELEITEPDGTCIDLYEGERKRALGKWI